MLQQMPRTGRQAGTPVLSPGDGSVRLALGSPFAPHCWGPRAEIRLETSGATFGHWCVERELSSTAGSSSQWSLGAGGHPQAGLRVPGIRTTILEFGGSAWEDGVEEGRLRAEPRQCREGQLPGPMPVRGYGLQGGGGPSGWTFWMDPRCSQMFHWKGVRTGGLRPPEPPPLGMLTLARRTPGPAGGRVGG